MNKKPVKLRRQIFVFTPDEKKAGIFVLVAFLVGLATMEYRKTHAPAARRLTAQQQMRQQAENAAKARALSAQRRRDPAAPRLRRTRPPAAAEDEGR
jgi:hypothetical protein